MQYTFSFGSSLSLAIGILGALGVAWVAVSGLWSVSELMAKGIRPVFYIMLVVVGAMLFHQWGGATPDRVTVGAEDTTVYAEIEHRHAGGTELHHHGRDGWSTGGYRPTHRHPAPRDG